MSSVRRLCLVLGLVLVAPACGEDSTNPDDPSSTASAVLPIQVDGSNEARELTLYRYFPTNVVARPGDTLRFKVASIGEPHTVAFGTLVDSAMAAVKKANLRSVEDIFFKEPPEMTVLPSIFGPSPTQKPENQAAGQPCFLDTGKPPVADACPKREQPAFDGTQAYFNSGLIENDHTFDVKLSDTIRPATYNYINVVYRGLMAGSVTVVDKDTPRPGPKQVAADGEEELRSAVAGVSADLATSKRSTPDRAIAGFKSSSPTDVPMVFEPKEARIPVGGSMTWDLYLCHTITFNPPQGAYGDLKLMPDGSVRLNPIPYAPASAPEPAFLSGAVEARWDGRGYFNSGGLCALAPGSLTYKMTFTQAGTYQLVCLFHPPMSARITVG
jgi:plastocyanin